ncbi:fructose-6-phosphate aldolase [Sporanaerobacter acetigenes]|uniref:Fructose-6-phosphate aldolase 2 n=1 Tax=Sporanaerobacter acetigenes DSM 13106 TaxID=1123281 RepID=A0A1M5WI96_9FIRM|nr:fructose-6-phosphate aldolase [Sporanaerobacter acetigenes]SHH87118.1 fructose-6-phosphate aldolase 2 [Sporanaerobacter acetigenes DSM 13106]
MLILLDTANIEYIRKGIEYYPIDGVTTNPSIISKENKDFLPLLKEIRKIIGKDKALHIQALGTNAEDIIEEALYINDKIGGNLYVKIPVINEGIKAMKILSDKNIKITATAVFTPLQALMAAKSGASFVAPYVNRLDNISGNGIKVVSDISKLFKIHNLDTKILAASFKNVEQVYNASLVGSHAATVPFNLIEDMLYHPLTNKSVDKFIDDWENIYGKNKKINHV